MSEDLLRADLSATAELLKIAAETQDVVALRTLGFHLAKHVDALSDCALAWLLNNMPEDFSTQHNGLSAIQNFLATRGELPIIARPWIGGYVLRCISSSELSLALSAFELTVHLIRVWDFAGIDREGMVEAVRNLRVLAVEDEMEDFERVEGFFRDLS